METTDQIYNSPVSSHAIPFHLLDGCVKVVVNGADKYISIDAFLEIIDKSLSASRASRTEEIFLPRGTVYQGRSHSKMFLNCYFKGGVQNLTYMDTTRPSVIPNIILAHTLEHKESSWSVVDTRYFCTDLEQNRLPRRFINNVSHPDRIFLLPFTNTYDGGNMCFGGNSMPRVLPDGNLRGLDWYYDFLFQSPFNSDLGLRALRDSVGPSAWYATLARLASDGQSFPYDRLHGFTPLA